MEHSGRVSIGVMQEWIGEALHELSQPLTALQCRLVIATRSGAEGDEQELVELRIAVSESLIQCDRLMKIVRKMQNQIGGAE